MSLISPSLYLGLESQPAGPAFEPMRQSGPYTADAASKVDEAGRVRWTTAVEDAVDASIIVSSFEAARASINNVTQCIGRMAAAFARAGRATIEALGGSIDVRPSKQVLGNVAVVQSRRAFN